ncbi:MAG: hypothetical protein GY898_07160 [Proteobacteria bacterium]|nr:hypothetical protein [Pseudomonadota bacterium]
MKDELSLSEMADRFGVSINGLSRALKRAGIERKTVRRGRGPAKKKAPPKGPDPRSAEAQDWWDEFLALKDRKPLADLAKRFGVAEITLQRAMKRTGTERRSQRGARGSQQARKAARRLKPLEHLLGTVPDAEIAAQTGLTRYAVAQYRRRNGVPSVRSGASRAQPAEVADPTPRPAVNGDAEAYLVRVSADGGDHKYVVLGKDLADAAAQAQAAVTDRHGAGRGTWTIEGLEFLGLAI